MNQAQALEVGQFGLAIFAAVTLGLYGATNMGTVWAKLRTLFADVKWPTPSPTVVAADRAALLASVVALRHKASEGKPEERAADLDCCDDFNALIDRLFPEAAK